MTTPMRAFVLAAAALLPMGVLDLAPGVSFAQRAEAQEDFVSRVNNEYRPISATRRSDTILLPLLAKMDKAPAGVNTPDKAALMPANSPEFAAAAEWAQAPAQKAVLEALHKVASEADWKQAYAFGQPYGADGVSPEIIRTGLYTELGDPPLLAAAKHMYLPALDAMAALANVEATRLTAEGKAADAVTLMIDLAYFGRQMADRQFFAEVAWGLGLIAHAMERARDIAYTDLRGQQKYEVTQVPDQIKRLTESEQGYMNLERIKYPVANRVAAEQLNARLYGERGAINENVFAATMSRLGASDFPLRLFSVAAQYQSAAKAQLNGFDAADSVRSVHNDFQRRWTTHYFDRLRDIKSDYEKLDRARVAVVETTTPNMAQLIEMRQKAKVEAAGTRMSLALVAFAEHNKNLPPTLASVRPRWIDRLEIDYYDAAVGRGGTPFFSYFIPMPKPKDPRDVAKPHEMQVYTSRGETNFKVNLQNDVWVLFSIGTDQRSNGARRIQNTTDVVQGADYLMWPPVLSLYRQHLIDRGDLKVTE
ncbi:MAG TPA: hypothetical protein VD997_14605 [Phycisphaerales bacterium]|nr:hypothetical protein [Phycisphaerales bacterium]